VGTALSTIANNNPISILYKNDEKFYFVVFYFLSSVGGTFFDQKLFMFYILFYFMKNETLENVFKAITFNITQLLSVGILGLVFVYVFCLIFYETYALDLTAGKDPKEMCDSIVYCILDLYVSGTIGGTVEELQFSRFLTDLIYYVFFGLLFSNIVSGIMIDTFA
jgi:inositol 1,4,5-triphosphate receptor type 1/inositol 1,4,5-triphosphate receptor type 3